MVHGVLHQSVELVGQPKRTKYRNECELKEKCGYKKRQYQINEHYKPK